MPAEGRLALAPLSHQIDVREIRFLFLPFDVAVGRVQPGVGNVVTAMLRMAALRLLPLVGRSGRVDEPCDVRNVNRFYHDLVIGARALEL